METFLLYTFYVQTRADELSAKAAHGSREKGSAKMAEILIVEDEFSINELIRRNLSLTGHHCTQAFDGLSAVKLPTTRLRSWRSQILSKFPCWE